MSLLHEPALNTMVMNILWELNSHHLPLITAPQFCVGELPLPNSHGGAPSVPAEVSVAAARTRVLPPWKLSRLVSTAPSPAQQEPPPPSLGSPQSSAPRALEFLSLQRCL